mmetsp:Transcript_47014/g.100358  ORF Transcript_47014/g.100358 Transcript_47014/m.100358 type:complete len:210 (-) Transcript_47014:726-1355(-)
MCATKKKSAPCSASLPALCHQMTPVITPMRRFSAISSVLRSVDRDWRIWRRASSQTVRWKGSRARLASLRVPLETLTKTAAASRDAGSAESIEPTPEMVLTAAFLTSMTVASTWCVAGVAVGAAGPVHDSSSRARSSESQRSCMAWSTSVCPSGGLRARSWRCAASSLGAPEKTTAPPGAMSTTRSTSSRICADGWCSVHRQPTPCVRT